MRFQQQMILTTLLASAIICPFGKSFGAQTEKSDKQRAVSPFFAHLSEGGLADIDESPVEMVMTADFSALLSTKGQSKTKRTFIPLKLEFQLSNGTSGQIEIAATTRGALRGVSCPFPPIKLDFSNSKKTSTAKVFKGVNEIKMVTHCGTNITEQGDFDELVRKEYLYYKIHQLLTPAAFRARLARVQYIDSSGKNEIGTHNAILIEDIGDAAKRLGGVHAFEEWRPEVKASAPTIKSLTQIPASERVELELFQVMIENSDYSLGHNMKPYRTNDTLHVIPYDFDFARMIQAQKAASPAYIWLPKEMACLPTETNESIVRKFQNVILEAIAMLSNTKLIADDKRAGAISRLRAFGEGLSASKIPKMDLQNPN